MNKVRYILGIRDWNLCVVSPIFAMTSLLVLCHCNRANAQDQSPLDKIKWVIGPATVNLGTVAHLDVPAGFRFTDTAGARLWYEATGNPQNNLVIGVLVPPSEVLSDPSQSWWISFAYDDCGHVSDDEKLDADTNTAILNSITQNTEQQNADRISHGWKTLKILGWQEPPHYDPQNHLLAWSISTSSDGSITPDGVNFTSRILGRTGVISGLPHQRWARRRN